MAERKLGQEVISRVVKKLGSVDLAAARLGIRPGLVERFVDGLSPVPDTVLLKALDLWPTPTLLCRRCSPYPSPRRAVRSSEP